MEHPYQFQVLCLLIKVSIGTDLNKLKRLIQSEYVGCQYTHDYNAPPLKSHLDQFIT